MNINKYIHNAIFRYSQCHFLEYICINFYTIKTAETQNIRFCKFVRTLKICLNDPICVPTTVLETLFHINENETRNIFNSQTNHYHWFQIRGEDNGCMRTRAQRSDWKHPSFPPSHTWYTVTFLGTKKHVAYQFGGKFSCILLPTEITITSWESGFRLKINIFSRKISHIKCRTL